MRFSQYEHYFSPPRMARFLAAAGGDPNLAKKYYKANIAVSASFLPVLNAFEVCLRNQLNRQLEHHFGRHDWIMTEKVGFMSHSSLGPRFAMKNDVNKAENRIRDAGHTVSASKVIAEQTLGFWVQMFEPTPYRLLRGVPILVFPYKPTTCKRTTLLNTLHQIRRFRNRIYHNEPICFSHGAFSLRLPKQILAQLNDLSQWIDPVFATWIANLSEADQVIAREIRRTGVRT